MGVPGARSFWELAGTFFGLELPEELHDEYGNTHTLFNAFDQGDDGSLLYPQVLPPGTKICLAIRDEERMFADLDKMVAQLIECCQGRTPYAVFHADCAARGRWSLNRVLKDEIVQRMQFPLIQEQNVPWLGLYGFGEFSQLGGRNRFHMFTTSLFVILKKGE